MGHIKADLIDVDLIRGEFEMGLVSHVYYYFMWY